MHPWPVLRRGEPHLQLPRQRLRLQGPVGIGRRIQVSNAGRAAAECGRKKVKDLCTY